MENIMIHTQEENMMYGGQLRPLLKWKPVVWGLVRYIDAIFTNDNWSIPVDCITTRAGASKVYAHIDTPYRFKEFNQVDRTLGVQIIIPLDIFTLQNGATAYLPVLI